jgi:uncharacterized LabA/DUF88 family protein
MADDSEQKRLAVLIDADNTSAKVADGLFEEVAKLGGASVRRIYGDFASPHSKAWVEVLAKHALNPQQQFAYTVGKNASDITLVIDAMDLLHRDRFDGFCLVSSDSDFTRLASRIREEGVDVFGFGKKSTPESFRQACTRFIYIENLLPEARTAETTPQLAPVSDAARDIGRIIDEMSTDGGWVSLGGVGTQLNNFAPDFDSRTYGFRKLSDLVKSMSQFELQKEGQHLLVRRKRAPAKAAKKSPGKA